MFEDGTWMLVVLEIRLHPNIMREMGFSVSPSGNLATSAHQQSITICTQVLGLLPSFHIIHVKWCWSPDCTLTWRFVQGGFFVRIEMGCRWVGSWTHESVALLSSAPCSLSEPVWQYIELFRYYRVLMMVYNTQRYWVFGLCPSSWFEITKNTTFRKLDLFPSSGRPVIEDCSF
jgi:hypothetical protein